MPSEERLRRLVERIEGRDGLHLWRAPGRVNLIGEHIDYLGGRVLPFACDREVLLAAVPHAREVVLSSLEEPEPAVVPLDGEPELAGWTRYVGGVVAALREAGLGVRGVRGALSSSIPIGAGLSSSAALEAAVALAVTDARPVPPEVLREAEYRATGVPCGVMDQAAVLGGRAGHALLLDCGTGEVEALRLPESLGFVVVDTGTRRRLTDGRYAERQREVVRAFEVVRRRTGAERLDDLRPEDVDELGEPEDMDELGEPGRRRLRHAVTEQRRVDEAVRALRAGDLETLGALLDASHVSLRDDFEVSSEALDDAVDAVRSIDGCLGARLVGAGFAGCVLAAVRAEATEGVAAEASRLLEGRLPGVRSFPVQAVDGAGPAEDVRGGTGPRRGP